MAEEYVEGAKREDVERDWGRRTREATMTVEDEDDDTDGCERLAAGRGGRAP